MGPAFTNFFKSFLNCVYFHSLGQGFLYLEFRLTAKALGLGQGFLKAFKGPDSGP